MEFMRDGGFGMWLMLGTAIATAVLVATRPRAARGAALATGIVAVLAEGLLSVGVNLEAVAANYNKFPNPLEALGTGIGEAANAAWFASVLAALLGAGLVVVRRQGGASHA